MQSCQVTPCLQELWAPVSPSLCSQEPRTGEGGAAPTSLCSWCWTRGAPCCLWGVGGQSWVLQREMRKPPRGIFKENMLEQQLLDSYTQWPHSDPNIPANVRAAGGASPATSGASADRTCALGRRAQGIVHSSAWIVTTLWTWTSHMEASSAHQPSLVWWLQEPEPRQGPRSCVL